MLSCFHTRKRVGMAPYHRECLEKQSLANVICQ